ncbi:hypothetical protein A5647_15600 [Mycobacterium sp. 1100029.7]|nr:hypothetical protein A5647_15600 [Mycobacterium sp. 1100029.7]
MGPAAMVHRLPGAFTPRQGRMIPVDPVGQVARVVPGRADLADRVVPAGTAPADRVVLPADRADPVVPDPVVRVDPVVPDTQARMVRVVPADQVARAVPADRVVPGTGTITADTSTTRPGATDPLRGDRANRLGPRGIDRSRRLGLAGITARSTTGATRKPPCGIPASTSGASGSSESGFRCKQLT